MNVVRNSFIVFFSKVLAGVLLFFSQIILARFLGPVGLGVYNLFLAVTGTALLLGGLGFGTASIYFSNKLKEDFSKLLSNSIIFGFIWGCFLAVLVGFVYVLFPAIFTGLAYKYFFIALLTIPFVILYNYCLPLLLSKLKIITWAVFSVLYSIFILFLSLVFVVYFNLGIQGAIFAVFSTVLVNFILIFVHLSQSYKMNYSFDKSLFLRQLKFGISTYLGDIFSTVNFKINIFIINAFLGVIGVGYYSVSYNIAALILVIPYSLQQVLYPTWSSVSESEVDKKTPRVARQALIFSFLSAIGLALVGRFFIRFFYGPSFIPAINPFYLILPGGIFAAYAGIFFNNFFAKGKPHFTSLILIGSLIINIILNVLLIPIMGVSGAALSAFVSYFLAALAAVFIFWRMSKITLAEIFLFKASDFIILYDRFLHLFTSVGKILNEVSSKDIKGLKDYYEKKADGFNIVKETFESPNIYKKMMYMTRVQKAMEFMDPKSSDNILEIGCGEGYYTNKLLEKTNNVTATDIAEKFLEKARKNTDNRAIKYIACPAEKLPFPDNFFDKVFISEVIEHLLDWEVGIKEIFRVLKPGGYVVITTPSKFSYFNILCHVRIMLKNKPFDGDHIREFSRPELSKLIKNYFVVDKYGYTNYFPVFLPKGINKFFSFETIKRAVVFFEKVLSSIPLIKEQGLIFFIKARKK